MTRTDDAEFTRPGHRWTRDRWLQLADRMLAPIPDHSSPGGALVRLPGPVSASGMWSDGLEGFARSFLLAAFRVRGEQGADPAGLLERYARGLRHGTDPYGDERWPRMDERRQAVVEAASIAICLSETREWLWDRLDERTRDQTVAWLSDIVGTSGYGNNWIWFQNAVEAFLRQVGGPWDQADLDRNEELQEQLYVGDGWYSDGHGREGRRQTFDYYAGWAWHLYPLLVARIHGAPLAPAHAERLRAYLGQAQQLVGSRGAPVLHGRSLTYRFAVLAPFWAGALADATPLRPGQTRALTGAVMEHFTEAGAVDDTGLLSVGWHRRYDRLRQLYTGGSSPLWASKAFLGLLLPPDHAVWTDEPELPEPWTADGVTLLRAPGWLVSRTPRDGIVRLVNHGSERRVGAAFEPQADDPFYARHGYSNITSPQLSPSAATAPVESTVALLDDAGTPSHRAGLRRVHVTATTAVSRSRVHWLDLPGGRPGDSEAWAALRYGPQLWTASVVRGPHEVRLAWWTHEPEDTGRAPSDGEDVDANIAWPRDDGPWQLRIGGWALAADDAQSLVVEQGPDWQRVSRPDGTSSLVRGLVGLDVPGTTSREGADPLAARSVTPWLRTGGPWPEGQVCAALVTLSGDAGSGGAGGIDGADGADGAGGSDRVVDSVEHVAPGRVEVRWHDGHVDVIEADEADEADEAQP